MQIKEFKTNIRFILFLVQAALHNTHVPRVTGAEMDGGQVDLTLSDDPFDCWTLDVSMAPIMVTLCKVNFTWL